MLRMIRYQLALLRHSQNYLPPVLLFIGLLAATYSNNSGTALPVFALSAGALLIVAGWLTIALVDTEDPVQRMVTANHAGSLRRVLFSITWTVLGCCIGLTALSVSWGVMSHTGPAYSAAEIAVGVEAHITSAAIGIAVALPCSRLLVPRIGFTVIAVSLLFGLLLLGKWVPPVHQLLSAMTNESIRPRPVVRAAVMSTVAFTASPILVARRVLRRG